MADSFVWDCSALWDKMDIRDEVKNHNNSAATFVSLQYNPGDDIPSNIKYDVNFRDGTFWTEPFENPH